LGAKLKIKFEIKMGKMKLKNLRRPREAFSGLGGILVRCRILPPCFFEWELDSHCFAVFADDVRAGLHASVSEEWRRLIHFRLPELVLVMQ